MPMTAPPALNQATALSGEAAEGAAGAMERGSLQIIMLIDSLIIFYYDVIFSIPLHILTSSGEAAEERNRGAAQRTERWRGGALVFRCMFLEQTPVCCNSFQFADNPRILEITIRHPDFDNTEILLR